MKVYKLETEWDLGLENEVYGTREAAMSSLRRAHRLQMIGESVEDCFSDGLYSIKEVELKS